MDKQDDQSKERRLMVHWQMEVHDGEGKRFVNAEFNVPIGIFNEQRRTLIESLESMMLEEGRLRGFTLPEHEASDDHAQSLPGAATRLAGDA